MTTSQGIVKWFNGKRGYGFVTDLDTKEDIFVHHSNINLTVECWKTLTQGEYIEFERETKDEKTPILGMSVRKVVDWMTV